MRSAEQNVLGDYGFKELVDRKKIMEIKESVLIVYVEALRK